MNMRQNTWTALTFAVGMGCKPAHAPIEGPPEASPWSALVAAEAHTLESRFPDAVVRIAVVDVASARLLAEHGPLDTPHATASTIKSFTVAAALEAGVDPATELDTADGKTKFGSLEVYDWTGHGVLDLGGAIATSSNVAMVRLAEKVGAVELYRGVARLVPLPEPEPLDEESAMRLVHGGASRLTTRQLVEGYALLARGGVSPEGQRRVSERTASQVMTMLERAVAGERGTGRAAALEGHRVAGKTGTGRTGELNVALFFGVTECEGREVVVGVVAEGVPSSETGGSLSAASFAHLAEHCAAPPA